MADLNFMFDIFVKSFDSSKLKTEDAKKLQVEAEFNKKKISITASRINVSDFNPNASTNFKEKDRKLRENLEDCGMSLAVKLKGRLLGNGRVKFPDKFVDDIKEGMSDLIYEGSCNIEKDNEEIGKLNFKCRLIVKCNGPEESECRRNMDSSINPLDIMFVLGETQKCPLPNDTCLDVLEPEEGDERLNLDLQRYRSLPTPAPNPADDLKHNPAHDAITSELKKMARECEETIDSILKGADSPTQQTQLKLDDFALNQFSKKAKPANDDKDKDQPDNSNNGIKPTRFCPVCLNNMSWLPKFAACPKCGAKPMPVLEERLKVKEPTPDEIIMEYLGKPQPSIEEYCADAADKAKAKAKDKDVQCRCSCRVGKLCAHCRVREACRDIFKLSSEGDPLLQSGRDSAPQTVHTRRESRRGSKRESGQKTDREPEAESTPDSGADSLQSIDIEDLASKLPGESDERQAHLARVFSELCFLYNIKVSNSSTDLQKICGTKGNQKANNKKGKKAQALRKPSNTSNDSEAAKDQKRTSNVQKRKSSARNSNVSTAQKRQSKSSNANRASSDKRGDGKKSGEHEEEEKAKPVIPRHLGWNWRTDPASKQGWRPGAISKPIKKIMDFFLRYSPDQNAAAIIKKVEIEQKENARKKQCMLHVYKKSGEIFITFRSVDPATEMNPIIYKIVKSDKAVRLSEMKKKFKEDGFRKCICHKSIMLCVCRTTAEKKELEAALEKECTRRGLESCPDELILTDTSESDMEYDFEVSPLKGASKLPPELGPNANSANQATQTAKKDTAIKPKYPIEQSPYYIPYNCATRLMYTGPQYHDDDDNENGGSPGYRNGNGGGGGNRGNSTGRGNINGNGNKNNNGRGNGNNKGRGNGNGNRRGNERGNGNTTARDEGNNTGRSNGNNTGRGNGNNTGRGNGNNTGRGNESNTGRGDGNNTGRGNGNNTGRGNGNNTGRGNGNNTGRGNGNNSGRGNGNNTGRGNASTGGTGKNNPKSNSNGNGQNSTVTVALPKRLQKNKEAAAKAEAEAKQKQENDKKKLLMKNFIALTKAPPIDRKKTLRALLSVMPPPVDSIPRRAKGTATFDDCYCDPCYSSCVPDYCPSYAYCC